MHDFNCGIITGLFPVLIQEEVGSLSMQLLAAIEYMHAYMGAMEGINVSKLQLLAAVTSPLLLLLVLLLLPTILNPSKLSAWRQPCSQCESAVQLIDRTSDIQWLKQQVPPLPLPLSLSTSASWMAPRKGINPRTRHQQLFDLRRYHGISHYENGSRKSEAISCPTELLVEPHHSYYGEPWAGGRDIFDFLSQQLPLLPHHRVLEVGCGTLRAGLHFIRFLDASNFYCWEKDPLSLTAALLYELPANGLLWKRPSLQLLSSAGQRTPSRSEGQPLFDLVYASAVFLHMPDVLVWHTVEVIGMRLAFPHGRLFVSHNIKFCTRVKDCEERLRTVGLLFVGKHTHDSLLFNHFEIWFEFRRLSQAATHA